MYSKVKVHGRSIFAGRKEFSTIQGGCMLGQDAFIMTTLRLADSVSELVPINEPTGDILNVALDTR
jgi:hypothetical protein